MLNKLFVLWQVAVWFFFFLRLLSLLVLFVRLSVFMCVCLWAMLSDFKQCMYVCTNVTQNWSNAVTVSSSSENSIEHLVLLQLIHSVVNKDFGSKAKAFKYQVSRPKPRTWVPRLRPRTQYVKVNGKKKTKANNNHKMMTMMNKIFVKQEHSHSYW